MARFCGKPGPGRPKGSQNKTTVEIRDAARRLLTDAKYVESLKFRLLQGKAPHMEVLLHHYAYGKPKEQVEHSGQVTLPVRVIHEYHTEATT